MKKLSFIAVILIFSFVSISAQPCPDSLYLTSQAQVDSFQILYPNCTEIEGDVVIIGDDITNLNGLNELTSVGGGLLIGNYQYGGNDSLTSLTGLDNVTSVGGVLYIWGNAALSSLTGLDNVTSVGGVLWIRDNDALSSLAGLDNVTSVGEDLYIGDNGALSSLAGLDNVTSVGGGLIIHNSPALTSLAGLDNVTSIGGDLWIMGNAALSSLTELDNVISVGGDLRIRYNAALSSLAGLDNINAESIEDLHIYENQLLSSCAILSICNYLAYPNGITDIYDNATGCNSPEEVQDSCEANGVNIDEQLIAEKVLIYPNPSSTHITIELPATPQKNTSLTIYNLNGQQLITQAITEPQTVVDVSGLTSGVYFVKVKDDKKVMVQKVIKK